MEKETGKVFSPVTQEEIAVAVKTGWEKAILERQQATQRSTSSGQTDWVGRTQEGKTQDGLKLG